MWIVDTVNASISDIDQKTFIQDALFLPKITAPREQAWACMNSYDLCAKVRGNLGITYIHLKTKGYMLAAVCTMLFTTALSSCGFSIIFFNVSRTMRLKVSFCCTGTVGLAKVSERKSEPHRRNSTLASRPMMGSTDWMICG